ncbi:MAG: hypothetical protein QHC90_14420 [Shinella sp.]|nr:hypothetical protein [Shinella sp.]
MTAATSRTSAESVTTGQAPLISDRFLARLTVGVAILAAVTAALSFAGSKFGERIALAGHTESTEEFDIFIGQDHLRLPANVIRFEEQRQTAIAQRADLYLTWPEMQGYSDATRMRFNDAGRPESLVFLQISQSTMSRDMSGRVEPIYSHLFEGQARPGPAGLALHQLKESSGYGGETLLTGALADGSTYAVRCLLPQSDALSTGADCQRDIHVGRDLSVLYRFSSRLLPHWQTMETAVRSYIDGRLVKSAPIDRATAVDKIPTNTETNGSS